MNKLVSLTMLALLSLGLSAGAAYTEDYGKQKVVYHIDTGNIKMLKSALRNIQNHINAVGSANTDLRVILHGDGVNLLVLAKEDTNFSEKISNLKHQGVRFNVCDNTLRNKHLNYKNDLYDVGQRDIVPSGMAEIVRLETLGYAYVKP